MEIRPILSALMRNKTGPVLIALQIAITLAIVANAAFIIQQRYEKMSRPSGIDVDHLIVANSVGFGESYDHEATVREDLEALRAMPGIADAGRISQIPMSGSGNGTGWWADPDKINDTQPSSGNYYSGDEHTASTLGLKLAEGRWFRQDEIEYRPGENYVPQVSVITKPLAQDLFGDESAIGQLVYDSLARPTRVIGVIEHMHGAWVNWERFERVMFSAQLDDPSGVTYMIRVENPADRDRLIPEIEAKLQEINRTRVITSVRTHRSYVDNSYQDDAAMMQLLIGVSALLVAVTALGIVGLAAFNVNQRRKQIGTRRALGATRFDILRYFLTEALLIAAAGIVLGCVLAFGMSFWLGTEFSLPPLDWRYVPPVVLGLIVISQLAVLGPARKASGISPAMATRSV